MVTNRFANQIQNQFLGSFVFRNSPNPRNQKNVQPKSNSQPMASLVNYNTTFLFFYRFFFSFKFQVLAFLSGKKAGFTLCTWLNSVHLRCDALLYFSSKYTPTIIKVKKKCPVLPDVHCYTQTLKIIHMLFSYWILCN